MLDEPLVFPTARTQPLDPPAVLARLRQERPVAPLRYPDGEIGWLVTRYDLVRAVFGDARFANDTGFLFPVDAGDATAAAQIGLVRSDLAGVMETTNPPDHTRLRRLHTPFFTSRRVAERREELERAVADALDALDRAGPRADLVRDFVLPVSAMMTCAFLDVPYSDPRTLQRLLGTSRSEVRDPHEAHDAHLSFMQLVHEVIAEQRARPAGGILAHLAASGELTEDELAGAVTVLFRDGTQNSAIMLAAAVFALLAERERWDVLRASPDSLACTVEELLRYLTVFETISTRIAFEDVDLDGTLIRAGERVSVSLSGADRDPQKFSDPDCFDAHRDASGHLAFGYGRHVCLGQHLVRVELEVMLSGLIGRFPAMALASAPEEVPVSTGWVAWSVPALLVDLGATGG